MGGRGHVGETSAVERGAERHERGLIRQGDVRHARDDELRLDLAGNVVEPSVPPREPGGVDSLSEGCLRKVRREVADDRLRARHRVARSRAIHGGEVKRDYSKLGYDQ